LHETLTPALRHETLIPALRHETLTPALRRETLTPALRRETLTPAPLPKRERGFGRSHRYNQNASQAVGARLA